MTTETTTTETLTTEPPEAATAPLLDPGHTAKFCPVCGRARRCAALDCTLVHWIALDAESERLIAAGLRPEHRRRERQRCDCTADDLRRHAAYLAREK